MTTRGRVFWVAVLWLLAVLLLWVDYQRSHRRERQEAILETELTTIRAGLDRYRGDHDRYPGDLDDLVLGGYLPSIPVDPFTGSRDSWLVTRPRVAAVARGLAGGIVDVHSGSGGIGTDGRPYSRW